MFMAAMMVGWCDGGVEDLWRFCDAGGAQRRHAEMVLFSISISDGDPELKHLRMTGVEGDSE